MSVFPAMLHEPRGVSRLLGGFALLQQSPKVGPGARKSQPTGREIRGEQRITEQGGLRFNGERGGSTSHPGKNTGVRSQITGISSQITGYPGIFTGSPAAFTGFPEAFTGENSRHTRDPSASPCPGRGITRFGAACGGDGPAFTLPSACFTCDGRTLTGACAYS
jgi:hypothetical protein